jgi:hypothetical protein
MLLQEPNLEDTACSVQHTIQSDSDTQKHISACTSQSTARDTGARVCTCVLRGLWLSRANMASDQIHLLTYLLTYSMEQSPSREANSTLCS